MDFSSLTNIDLWWMPILSGQHNIFFDQLAVALTSGWTWIPMYLVLLFVVIKNNETMPQIGLIILSVILLLCLSDGMADGIMKPLTQRLRPLNDPNVQPYLEIVKGVANKNYAFFSAHAANTFALCTFFGLVTRSKRLAGMLLAWSLLNCWTRIYLGLHYPSDIVAGLIWGFISGEIMYICYHHFFFKISPKLHFISSQYTRAGYALNDINGVLTTFLLIIIVAIFYTLAIQKF